jgi:hypothetical protein
VASPGRSKTISVRRCALVDNDCVDDCAVAGEHVQLQLRYIGFCVVFVGGRRRAFVLVDQQDVVSAEFCFSSKSGHVTDSLGRVGVDCGKFLNLYFARVT